MAGDDWITLDEAERARKTAVLKAERETLAKLGLAHECRTCRGVGRTPRWSIGAAIDPEMLRCKRCRGTGLVEAGENDFAGLVAAVREELMRDMGISMDDAIINGIREETALIRDEPGLLFVSPKQKVYIDVILKGKAVT